MKKYICAEIIDPNGLGLHFGAGGALVKENDVRLYAGLVEDAGGQTQDRVQIAGPQQRLPHDLSRAVLNEHIVRNNNGSLARRF